MDQLICASLSHTHYWYEVDMLKVPDDNTYMLINISVQYNGGFLSDIIVLTLCDNTGGPFEYM